MPPPAVRPAPASASARSFAPIDHRQRFPALDGIRALAVLMVFSLHYGGGAHGGFLLNVLNGLRLQGGWGVDIFFVLSGFLITGILYDTRDDSRFFLRFYARRSLRIFPIFYAVFALLLVLTPVVGYRWHALQLLFPLYLGNFAANADFSLYVLPSAAHPAWTAQLSHFWSLCVEEQFYLLWPVVVWLVRGRVRLLWTAGGLAALTLVLRAALSARMGVAPAAAWIDRTLPFRMDSLLIGGMLALLLRGPRAAGWQRSCRWWFLGGTLLTALAVYDPLAGSRPWPASIPFTLAAVASAGLIGTTLREGSAAYRLFLWKPLRTLGKYSYGFYIYHFLFNSAWLALLELAERRLHSLALAGVLVLGANLVVTFLVSKLSYDLFEVKFLRFKRFFEYDAEQRAGPGALPQLRYEESTSTAVDA